MLYTLRKQFRFEASHQLVGHDGKCARLHGHSWVGWVEVQGPRLFDSGPKAGMLVDYGDIAGPLKQLVEEKLDHYHLNDTLDSERPTSEFIATWVHTQLADTYRHRFGVFLAAVTIEETCTSYCEFRVSPSDG